MKKENFDSEHLSALRHSLAHVLAAAVLQIFPDAKLGIGPVIENGFYYDFDLNRSLTPDDLKRFEKIMKEILLEHVDFVEEEKSFEEAERLMKHQVYKLELIDEFKKEKKKITLYRNGGFIDLCKGGHVKNTREIPRDAFRLTHVAGAYWRGNEKNKMLQRIYAVAFDSKIELEHHLLRVAEAQKRDHRKLGQDLDLFVFSETVGKGLPLLTPRGSLIRRELERFIVDEEIKRGYLHVYSPDIAHLALYKKSGHYPYYKNSMYAPIVIDNEEYMLRPMTCPHHFELYLSRKRSYKELPMRLAEIGQLYRYEQSGELMGLLRVRTFSLADAHIICRKSQAEEQVNEVLDLIEYVASVFGLNQGEHYGFRLSLGDRSDEKKYYKDDASWDFAEKALRKVLKKRKSKFVEAPGEAAFYGPKIDVQMRNVNGREDTAFTVQYDFVMPKRFDLSYTNEKGVQEQPVVIHRSSIGAIERVMAFLIEHFAGDFPLWLAPVQVALLPVSEKHTAFSKKFSQDFLKHNIRVQIVDENETLGHKIRGAEKQKIPYIIVLGDKEKKGGKLMIRRHGVKTSRPMTKKQFIKMLIEKINKKSLA